MKPKQHWLFQRFSAIALAFLLAILLVSFFLQLQHIIYPLLLLMLGLGLWHGLLGIEVICEDYITEVNIRKIVINSVKTFVYISLAVVITIYLLI